MKKLLLSLLLINSFPVFAQQIVPQFGQDSTGTNRNVYVLNPTNSDWVSMGSFNTSTNVWSFPSTALVSSVGNASADSSLTFGGTGGGPYTGAVTVELNLANSNIWTSTQSINLNSATLPTILTGAGFRLGGADTVASRIENDAFGAAPYFSTVRTDGTNAAKTTLLSGDEIGGYNAWGYNGSAIVGPTAAFRTWANENWSSGHQGSYADIAATPNGTTSEVSVVQIVPSIYGGQVLVGNKPYENISGGQFTATYLMSLATVGVAQTSSGLSIVGTALQDGVNGYNYPTGLTGYCKLNYAGYDCQGSNNVVDMMTTGIGSNENDCNNWHANPSTVYPPVYANPTVSTYCQGLYLGAGGSYKSYAAIIIGQNAYAGAGAVWQAGIYMWPGTVSLYGELIDATSSVGPTNSIYSRNTGSSGETNLTLQQMGSNANGIVIKVLDATGPPVLAIDANGYVTNYLLSATASIFGVNDALGSQQAVVAFMELANEKWVLGMDTNGSFLGYDVTTGNAFMRVTTAALLKLGENAALQITSGGVSTFGYQTIVNSSVSSLFANTSSSFVVQNADTDATTIAINSSANNSAFTLNRTDGTFASPTIIVNTDVLGTINLAGYNGATTTTQAQIKALASANWVNGSDYETKVQILATAPSATATEIEATLQNGMALGTLSPKGVGTMNANAYFAGGSSPTGTTGSCAASSFTGGSLAGKFLAASCTAGTIILSALPAATNGYACEAQDQTTPADTLKQTANTTTSVTFTATTVASDAIVFKCMGF